MNQYIDIFLKNAHLVREAYKEVSKADRPSNLVSLPNHLRKLRQDRDYGCH